MEALANPRDAGAENGETIESRLSTMPAIRLAFMSDSETSLNLCASVPLWFGPCPKLTKTERKGRGAEKSNVMHQQLTTTRTDRPVSFPYPMPERAGDKAHRNLGL